MSVRSSGSATLVGVPDIDHSFDRLFSLAPQRLTTTIEAVPDSRSDSDSDSDSRHLTLGIKALPLVLHFLELSLDPIARVRHWLKSCPSVPPQDPPTLPFPLLPRSLPSVGPHPSLPSISLPDEPPFKRVKKVDAISEPTPAAPKLSRSQRRNRNKKERRQQQNAESQSLGLISISQETHLEKSVRKHENRAKRDFKEFYANTKKSDAVIQVGLNSESVKKNFTSADAHKQHLKSNPYVEKADKSLRSAHTHARAAIWAQYSLRRLSHNSQDPHKPELTATDVFNKTHSLVFK